MTSAGWSMTQQDREHGAVIKPIGDAIEHTDRFCICKPRWTFVSREGGLATIIVHNSLDGREQYEHEDD